MIPSYVRSLWYIHSFVKTYAVIADYKSKESTYQCVGHAIQVQPDNNGAAVASLLHPVYAPDRTTTIAPSSGGAHRRRRREPIDASLSTLHPVVRTIDDAIYLLIVKLEIISSTAKSVNNVTVEVKWHSSYGYLSAIDYPLLPFYA